MTDAHHTIQATGRREMFYFGACLTCDQEKIRGMVARARPISYSAARRSIGPVVLDAWAATVESTFGPYWRGLQLKRNRALVFYRSRYDAFPCVYVVHKRVRHIFCRHLL